MVPDTQFTCALAKPLDIIQDIYAKSQDKSPASLVKQVESHFRSTFANDDAIAKIPMLTPSNLASLLPNPLGSSPTNKLVRFRGMIQDTGLGTEVFLATHHHGSTSYSGLFGGEARFAGLHDQDLAQSAFSNNNLAERSVMYAVSTPGQTAWVSQQLRQSSSVASTSTNTLSATSSSDSTSVSRMADGVSRISLHDSQSPQKIQQVRERIKRAVAKAKSIGSSGKEPRLVAISKLHPPSTILAAHLKAGQTHFGENYVQELVDKAKVLPREIMWHFVGSLQSNKAKLLACIPNLYLLETLDSVKAANLLQKVLASPDAAKRDQPLQVYLQVNTSGEEAKNGLPPILSSDNQQDSTLLELALHVITNCPQLRFRGVMTIGAAANSCGAAATEYGSVDEVIKANPDFEKLIITRRNLVQLLRADEKLKDASIPHIQETYGTLLGSNEADGGLELSMGMSADMEIAIMVGSDNVRVGTDCFGSRPKSREEAMNAMKRELQVGPEAALAELRSDVRETATTTFDSGSTRVHTAPSSSALVAYPQKAPLPEQSHVGTLVKFYDLEAAEKFKTAELVEVVGILDSASLPHAEWQETGAASQASGAGASTQPEVPCIHVVVAEPADVNRLSASSALDPASNALSDETEGTEMIEYLAGALGGDKLAAEFVLLALVARIHARRANLCLGALTLNLSNFASPPTTSSNSPHTELSRRLTQLLPSLVEVPMDLASLNDSSKPLFPRSSSEGAGLEAGRLQLPNGTTLLINEGNMREGELEDMGIRNIRALASLLESHKLPYAFPYSEFEFDTDLNSIILSQGKSFLPFDIQCPLTPADAGVDLYKPSTPQVAEDKLRRWRQSLLEARSLATAQAFQIPESVSQHIQQDFVEERRREQDEAQAAHGSAGKPDALGQEDLLRRMAIVRLLAISHGQKSLCTNDWKKAVQLDKLLVNRAKSVHPPKQQVAATGVATAATAASR